MRFIPVASSLLSRPATWHPTFIIDLEQLFSFISCLTNDSKRQTKDSIGHHVVIRYPFLGGLKEGFDGRFDIVVVLFQQSYTDGLVRIGDRLHLHENGLFEFFSTVRLDCGRVNVAHFFGS
jgi:hypothetical protein